MKVTFIEVPEDNKVDVHIDDMLIRRNINTTKDGKQFIYVPNMYHPNGGGYTFNCRPSDMVQAMRDGYGDAIEVGHLMVRTEHLIRFLDRKYGEEMRAKSLEGWEGTEFAWTVNEQCGMMGDVPLTVADIPLPIHCKGDARDYPIKYYDTEEAAQAFIDDLSAELMPKITAYRALSTVAEKNAYYENEMKQYTGLKESIILKIADDDRNIPLHVCQVIRKSNLPMQELPVHYIEYIGNTKVFMCRGDAIESDESSSRMIKTGTLYTTSSVEDLFADNERIFVYRLIAGDCKTNWYSDLQSIFDSDEYQKLLHYVEESGCDCVSIEDAVLRKQKRFPIIPTSETPYDAIVEEGAKGLTVFANLNPDEIGSYTTRRKVYFPDRSCATKICAGKVRITGIEDKGKYGFFIGEMVSYDTPSEEELVEWILNKHNKVPIQGTVIQFIKNPLWGSAIRLHNTNKPTDIYCTRNSKGEVSILNLLDIYDHSKDEIVEEISVEDFICSGYAGATKDELCAMVPHVDQHPGWDASEISPKFISEDFDLAIECGLIVLLKLKSIHYCRICPDRMYKAASILRNDLIPVLEKAAEINRAAMERFNAKKKKN